MPRFSEKQMRSKIKAFIADNFKSVEEYAQYYGFNADYTRKSLRSQRPISTGMIATVSAGKIPIVHKEVKVYYEYET